MNILNDSIKAAPEKEKEAVFIFLDQLRESGVTNMFGAAPYITDAFGYDDRTARALLKEWMNGFIDRNITGGPDETD